jgi:salicylate hydroxylase
LEDAEALGAFFEDVSGVLSGDEVGNLLQEVFVCRYERASLVQKYSRDSARPATEKGSNEVKMYVSAGMTSFDCR